GRPTEPPAGADRRAARGGQHRRRARGHGAVADDGQRDHDLGAAHQHRAPRGDPAADRLARGAGGRGAHAHAGRPHRAHPARLPAPHGDAPLGADAAPPAGVVEGARGARAVGDQGGRQHPERGLHERPRRLHGDDAPAVAAEPRGGHVAGRAQHRLRAVRLGPRLRVLRRERVLHEGHGRAPPRLLPPAPRHPVAAGDPARGQGGL
ncbi:MAG: Chemotaxis protein CheC -- inhibitor of MCP methylation, partial [uncultured Gemmatimonadaceae bacterium]